MTLIETVRTQTGLSDDAEAERGAAAVLEALGGRIASGNVQALAAELPVALAGALRRGSDGEAHSGGIAELAEKTAAILGASEEEGVAADPLDLVAATLRGIVESVPRDVVDTVSSQLPADLTQLLIAETEGEHVEAHANSPQPGEPGTQPGLVRETGDPAA